MYTGLSINRKLNSATIRLFVYMYRISVDLLSYGSQPGSGHRMGLI